MTPRNPDFVADARRTVAVQSFLSTIGAALTRVEPGLAEMTITRTDGLGQQDSFVHGGVLATLADVTSGVAALSLAAKGDRVLTVEFKINFLRPAAGIPVHAVARVVKSGRTLAVMQADVFAGADAAKAHVATAIATYAISAASGG
jgi:uncharacterized protein (TIGR00369 family)